MPFSFVLTLCLLIPSVALSNTCYKAPLICNNSTGFKCVCYTKDKDLLGIKYPLCKDLIKMPSDKRNLTLTRIVFGKQYPITATIHPGLQHETWFKKKISRIITKECSKRADKCLGIGLPVDIESIVLINVMCEQSQQTNTTIDFVVTRSRNISAISSGTIANEKLVTKILLMHQDNLARILGGIKIDRIENTLILALPEASDMTGLITCLIILAFVLVLVYMVAIVKAIKDRQKANARILERQKQQREENNRTPGQTNYYGAMDNGTKTPLLQNCANQTPNEHLWIEPCQELSPASPNIPKEDKIANKCEIIDSGNKNRSNESRPLSTFGSDNGNDNSLKALSFHEIQGDSLPLGIEKKKTENALKKEPYNDSVVQKQKDAPSTSRKYEIPLSISLGDTLLTSEQFPRDLSSKNQKCLSFDISDLNLSLDKIFPSGSQALNGDRPMIMDTSFGMFPENQKDDNTFNLHVKSVLFPESTDCVPFTALVHRASSNSSLSSNADGHNNEEDSDSDANEDTLMSHAFKYTPLNESTLSLSKPEMLTETEEETTNF